VLEEGAGRRDELAVRTALLRDHGVLARLTSRLKPDDYALAVGQRLLADADGRLHLRAEAQAREEPLVRPVKKFKKIVVSEEGHTRSDASTSTRAPKRCPSHGRPCPGQTSSGWQSA
jgi:hypothetical protein